MRKKLIIIAIGLFIFALLANGFVLLMSQEKAYLDTIDDKIRAGQIEEAEEELNEFLVDNPDSGLALVLKGNISYQRSELADALEYYNQAIEQDNELFQAYAGLGRVFRDESQYVDSEINFKKALELVPENSDVMMSLAMLYLVKEDFNLALTNGEQAYAQDTKNPTYAANLSVIYHFNSNFFKRDELFEKAADLGYANLDELKDIYKNNNVLFNGQLKGNKMTEEEADALLEEINSNQERIKQNTQNIIDAINEAQ